MHILSAWYFVSQMPIIRQRTGNASRKGIVSEWNCQL